jgi:hypothetical protein
MSRIVLDPNRDRLCLGLGGDMGGWGRVAEKIKASSRSLLTWFPDANVAFRLAGLGAQGGVAVLTETVLGGMQEWLEKPFHDHDRARDIKAAIKRASWLQIGGIKQDSPNLIAVYGYLHLLGLRRLLAVPLVDGSTRVGTEAIDKVGTMNVIKDKIGPRAQGLAKKGWSSPRKMARRRL